MISFSFYFNFVSVSTHLADVCFKDQNLMSLMSNHPLQICIKRCPLPHTSPPLLDCSIVTYSFRGGEDDKIPSAQLQLWHLSTICLLFCFSREVIILRQWRNPCVLVLLLFWEIHAHVLMAPQHLVTGNTVILLCTSSIACHHKLIVIGSCASYKKGLFNF